MIVRIRAFNPCNFQINGIPIDELPEIKRYCGTFELKKGKLFPAQAKEGEKSIEALLDCTPSTEIYGAINRRPFHLHKEETGGIIPIFPEKSEIPYS